MANVGILTGKESGLVVLDVDPRHGGEESLQGLSLEYGALPKTLTVKTGGNGWHYYFRHPGGRIPNKAGFRDGLDIRGDGGYIVAPPSTHSSLQPYLWMEEDCDLAPMPDWLLTLLTPPSSRIIDSGMGGESLTATERAKRESGFLDGYRNSSLLSIGGFLRTKGLNQEAIAAALDACNQSLCSPPIMPNEMQEILASVARYEEKQWSEPTALPLEATVPEMTLAMLPSALQEWCSDISERMQVPLEFAAGPAIVSLASLMGRKVVVYPKIKDDWQIVPNLWGCLIAPPGSMKTPAMSAVLKPMHNLAIKAREEYLSSMKKLEAEKEVARTEIEALKDVLKGAIKQGKQSVVDEKKALLANAIKICEEKYEITERRYMMNDPTIEKFLTISKENPQGLLLYRDELSGWIETMYKSGREGDRQFFLEAWNGDTPYSMDRIGRGTIFVDGLCLSVLGGLQPSKFQSYAASLVKGGKSDDGLLQRFQILLYPEKRKTWRKVDREPNFAAASRVAAIFDKVAQLPQPIRQDEGIRRTNVRFDEGAQSLVDNWRENLEARLFSGTMSPILESHLSKYRSLMPKLALVFEVADVLGNGDAFPDTIGIVATRLAISWCEFLEKHARKSYGEFLEPEFVAARILLEKIKAGAVRDYDRCREIYRHGWKGISSLDELDGAVKTLEKHGWVRIEVLSPPTGRRFEVIRLHPSLRMG